MSSGTGHGHGHDHRGGHDHSGAASDRRLWLAFALTAGFMGLEVLAGLWAGSLALLADAGHMLTDAASLGLALYAAATSRRGADDRRSYGYGRTRVLAAFVNGLSLLLIAVWIVIEAVQRLRDPPHILAGPMLAVAIAGLLVNVLAYRVLRGGEDLNTRGALAHVVGDMLGSVAAISAAGVIMATGWTQADPLLSLAVALLIVRTGWKISGESAHILLEGTPDSLDATSIRDSLMASVPGVCDVHHIHAWLVGAEEPHMTLHVQFAESVPSDLAVAAVCSHLSNKFGVHHVTVQLEYLACTTREH